MKHQVTSLINAIIFLVIGLMAAACDPTIVEEISPSVGIIGGEPTNYDKWQGAIAIYVDDDKYGNLLLCTGTLIHPQIVLTAGHCMLLDDGSIFYDFRETPNSIKIRGGATMNDMETFATATDIRVHTTWEGQISIPWTVDFAMIFLDKPIDNIEYYPIRYGTSPVVGESGVIVGYGISDQKDVPAMSTAGVHRAGNVTLLFANDHAMIAGGDSSICLGDSGGPLFTLQDDEWVVAAVHSSVIINMFGELDCDPGTGGTHHSTVTYRGWINDIYQEWIGERLPGGPDPTIVVDGGANVQDSGQAADGDAGVINEKDIKVTADCSCYISTQYEQPSIMSLISSFFI